MQRRRFGDEGFSLVEIIIAMLILGIIAIALLPPLWQGIRFASEQAHVATATRQLNALIEEAREAQSCTAVNGLAPSAYEDGVEVPIGDPHDFTVANSGGACTPASLITIQLTATAPSGMELVTVTAEVWVN